MLQLVPIIRQGLSHIKIVNFSNVQPWCLYRCLHTTPLKLTFFQRDPKSGYNKDKPKPSHLGLIRHGLKQIKEEIKLWKQEVVETLEGDLIMSFNAGEVDKKWEFRNEKDLDKWVITSDSDHAEGYSISELTINKTGKGLFSGNLCNDVPKDGRVKRSGYCNMKSLRPRKSFQRQSYYDWGMYSHLIIRVRGDGRRYMLHIGTSGYYDQTWNDSYNYVLFTRGGPYWQIAKIPFSKFFFSSKGRIQDKQCSLYLQRVTSFGITIADKNDGPFALEIDYIGLEFDPSYREQFAYEMYKTDKFIVGS